MPAAAPAGRGLQPGARLQPRALHLAKCMRQDSPRLPYGHPVGVGSAKSKSSVRLRILHCAGEGVGRFRLRQENKSGRPRGLEGFAAGQGQCKSPVSCAHKATRNAAVAMVARQPPRFAVGLVGWHADHAFGALPAMRPAGIQHCDLQLKCPALAWQTKHLAAHLADSCPQR